MLRFQIREHQLRFKKPAKTSRNTFESRTIYLLDLWEEGKQQKGTGEAAPLSLLSIDDLPDYRQHLENFAQALVESRDLSSLDLEKFPSIRFGLETALLSLKTTNRRLFDSPFTQAKKRIPINGLVWMNDTTSMLEEARLKIAEGYHCIKFKIGAQDFDDECRMLETLRKQFSAHKLEIRLDANGAFLTDEAQKQIVDLQRFDIHSLEQPIAAGNWDAMAKLCREAPLAIALDEELIGLNPKKEGDKLLQIIHPQYLIFKPNLIGGLSVADDWIKLSRKHKIGWWATSALESNVGLNAITQWVSTYEPQIPQGLGTGALYTNNFDIPWKLEKGWISWSDQR